MAKAKSTAEVLSDPIGTNVDAELTETLPIITTTHPAAENELVPFATRIPKWMLKEMKICCVRGELSVILFIQGAIEAHLHEHAALLAQKTR